MIVSGFLYTNPMLNYQTTNALLENKNINLENEIIAFLKKELLKKTTTHISLYYRNLNNGNWFWVNEKEEFSPASLMKLPLLMSYYKLSETYPEIINDTLVYIPKDEDEIIQNFQPQKTLEKYKQYTIKDLLDRMIIYSDNKSSLLLENLIDIEVYKKSFTDIGMNFPSFKNWEFENNITVADYSSFFRVLYNSSYLTRSNSEYILDLLSKVRFGKWLVKNLPQNIVVSHKFWERIIGIEKQLHDCWIIYYPNHPYILCIMTRGYDWHELENIIWDLSKKIYTEVDNQYKK